ncbi:AGAP003838-PA-like protein [Anopheles sinensis]|uniref:AGAP003838-PA-like protein n=1 Tax=Anopheles sinensis TaxID=74873 RepID=A0A084WNT0_ANOSI|nr:AGAP003838-PA-like protein [Anopheles sinensis]
MTIRKLMLYDRNVLRRLFSTDHRQCRSKHESKLNSYDSYPDSMLHPMVKGTGGSFKWDITEPTRQTLYKLKDFIDEFTGGVAVRESQQKVNELQDKVSELLDKRSKTELKLLEVKKKVTDVNAAQHTVSHGDVNYFGLLREEFLLKSEKQNLENMLEVLSHEHQVLLLQLTHALSDVHAKERQEVNNMRVIKLFLTIVLGIAGFAGNAGYNHYKDRRVQQQLEVLVKYVEGEKARQGKPSESWGSYLYRQPGRFYRYMFPKQG